MNQFYHKIVFFFLFYYPERDETHLHRQRMRGCQRLGARRVNKNNLASQQPKMKQESTKRQLNNNSPFDV
jgi:hypothetical protein